MTTPPDPSLIQGYHVYEYTFLDDLQFIKRPEDVFDVFDMATLRPTVEAVKKRFLGEGWEGDGDLGVIWLPPFVDAGVEDTWGTYIWHVKQSNNGISFLASKYPLDFARLADQAFGTPRGRPVHIIETAVGQLRSDAKAFREKASASLAQLEQLPAGPTADNIFHDLLVHYQGHLVRALNTFLDECYLQFLVEVICDGNRSKIKLQKSRVQINADRYFPEEDAECPNDEGGQQWLTVRAITSDIWRAFKFEPYPRKLEMLFGAVKFSLDPEVKAELMKHVVLRNCIQHHEGRLDNDSLNRCGKTKFVIRKGTGTYDLEPWSEIIFTKEELLHLGECLERFATDFSQHVDRRVPTRRYLVEPQHTE